jgi:hypothetical protein
MIATVWYLQLDQVNSDENRFYVFRKKTSEAMDVPSRIENGQKNRRHSDVMS